MTSVSATRKVGRYEILRELGRGGTAVVYLARQTDLDRLVALKDLAAFHAADPAFVERFVRESRLTGAFNHPNMHPRKLLQAPRNVTSPDWSPDGRRIAYGDVVEHLWVMQADGSHPRRLGPATLTGRGPRWSPDGARVAFADAVAGADRILDVRTGSVTTLVGLRRSTATPGRRTAAGSRCCRRPW